MNPKISVILPTNRINSRLFFKIENVKKGLASKRVPMFTGEFPELARRRLKDTTYYLEPTLNSLETQSFRDFELIISHRYPEDVTRNLDLKKYNFPIKLVREKDSIWHHLGDHYWTLNNNINTAVIHSNGELLWRLDDLTFFNDNVLQEFWDCWKEGKYVTSRGVRCIDYDESNPIEEEFKNIGKNKWELTGHHWRGEIKPLTDLKLKGKHIEIGKHMCWGFSSTISIDDFLSVNGQDELYDGAVCGTDIDLGLKISYISRIPRVASINFVYEINDVRYKYNIRDDVVMRDIWNVSYLRRSNTWKPSESDMKAYEIWHKANKGDLDPNWNKFMDVPFIDMIEEYKKKEKGEIIYESGYL